ncbi:hypothetical protein [Sorangium sp. So ce124]|uniref:hypothetical protein n=1 Tax=Sorangium sp. So ce124 TaxID=3133280 RepID=UPI003F62D9B4
MPTVKEMERELNSLLAPNGEHEDEINAVASSFLAEFIAYLTRDGGVASFEYMGVATWKKMQLALREASIETVANKCATITVRLYNKEHAVPIAVSKLARAHTVSGMSITWIISCNGEHIQYVPASKDTHVKTFESVSTLIVSRIREKVIHGNIQASPLVLP